MQKSSWDLCWALGLAFCLTQLSTQVPSLPSKKVSPCWHPCHTWDLGLGTLCEVVSPNFHALNDWDYMDWPKVTWDLGLGTPCELALSIGLNNAPKCVFKLCHIQMNLFLKCTFKNWLNILIQLYTHVQIHSKLHSIMHVATKVHVISRSPIVLTWMWDIRELL